MQGKNKKILSVNFRDGRIQLLKDKIASNLKIFVLKKTGSDQAKNNQIPF